MQLTLFNWFGFVCSNYRKIVSTLPSLCNTNLELSDVSSVVSAWAWLQQLLIRAYFQTIFPRDTSPKRMQILRSMYRSVVVLCKQHSRLTVQQIVRVNSSSCLDRGLRAKQLCSRWQSAALRHFLWFDTRQKMTLPFTRPLRQMFLCFPVENIKIQKTKYEG